MKILGVRLGVDAYDLRKAYRKLVKTCHPDTHPGDKKAEDRFKDVSEAYNVLSNPISAQNMIVNI